MSAVESSRVAAGPLKGLDNESERQQPDTVTALPAFREEDGEKPTAWQQKMILQTQKRTETGLQACTTKARLLFTHLALGSDISLLRQFTTTLLTE